MKPSDFPRDDLRFRTPGPAFILDGVAHLRSYADVKRVLLNRGDEFSQDASYWRPKGRIHVNFDFMWATGSRRADGSPGRHAVLRRLIEQHFRQGYADAIDSAIRCDVDSLLHDIVTRGTGQVDLASELAYRVSTRTAFRLLGLPLEQEQWLRGHLESFDRAGFDVVDREPEQVEAFLWQVVADRRRRPGDQLVDVLVAAWRDEVISDLELLAFLWSLASADSGTTGTNIVNAFGLLAEFDLLDTARARLDDVPWIRQAGEEVLRFGSPFPAGPSLAVADVTLASGLTIPAMTPVLAWISAANRDPAVNRGNPRAADPDVFDVERDPNHHLSFGVGMHTCLGSQLARLETRIALQTTLRRLPGLEPDPSRPFERYAGIVDGVTQAPFRFDQDAAIALVTA